MIEEARRGWGPPGPPPPIAVPPGLTPGGPPPRGVCARRGGGGGAPRGPPPAIRVPRVDQAVAASPRRIGLVGSKIVHMAAISTIVITMPTMTVTVPPMLSALTTMAAIQART